MERPILVSYFVSIWLIAAHLRRYTAQVSLGESKSGWGDRAMLSCHYLGQAPQASSLTARSPSNFSEVSAKWRDRPFLPHPTKRDVAVTS